MENKYAREYLLYNSRSDEGMVTDGQVEIDGSMRAAKVSVWRTGYSTDMYIASTMF